MSGSPVVVMALILALGAPQVETDPPAGLAEVFAGLDATFVLYDRASDRYHRHDEVRAAVRFSPCSTFKIPNSLIALETGVVDGPDTPKPWDPNKHPCAPSNSESRCKTLSQAHTLRTALANSVVWYYQEVALAVGQDRMDRFLEVFDYGNRDTSAGIDTFWLAKTLKISADEQIEFLRKFHDGKLGSEKNTAIVKDILVVEETDTYRLSAKTGMGWTPEGRPLGWYVGYVERGPEVYFFALNLEADDFGTIQDNRIQKAREALTAFKLLD